LVKADEAAGEPEMFVLYYTQGSRIIIGHPGWPQEQNAPSDVQVDELEDQGWVRVNERDGKSRNFAVTSAGREEAAKHAAHTSLQGSLAVDLAWPGASKVLKAVFDAYVAAGAPEHGVPTSGVVQAADDQSSTGAALRELVRGAYLETTIDADQVDVPLAVRPTTLTLQYFAGWPGSSQTALDELVTALDKEIERTTDETKRTALTRVRDGLLGAARDVALAYLEKRLGLS
jgi:hypothetical protein